MHDAEFEFEFASDDAGQNVHGETRSHRAAGGVQRLPVGAHRVHSAQEGHNSEDSAVVRPRLLAQRQITARVGGRAAAGRQTRGGGRVPREEERQEKAGS